MGIRRTILTSGGLASAIGICLAVLSAGTLVVFSAIAARVGLEDGSTDASVASPRVATKDSPAAITFPATEEPSEESRGTPATGNTSLLDVIGSALDESTSTVAADSTAEPPDSTAEPPDSTAEPPEPDDSGPSTDAGSEQVASTGSDIDFGGDNALSGAAERSASRVGLRSNAVPRDDDPKPKKNDEDNDRVAARRDDDGDPDHGDDNDDDDGDGDSARSRAGSSDGSGDGRVARVHAKVATAKAKAKGHAKAKAKGHPKAKGHS